MDRYAPLIGTAARGPLGLVHLPRLWLKMLLASQGKLAEGYRAGAGGFDGALLKFLGIASVDAVDYVAASQPTYLAFEAWVRDNAAPDRLATEAIAQFNERILSFAKPEPGRSEMLADLGMPDDDTEWSGADLNNLDDWCAFHQALLQDVHEDG
jgi:hypothetical protein